MARQPQLSVPSNGSTNCLHIWSADFDKSTLKAISKPGVLQRLEARDIYLDEIFSSTRMKPR